MPETWKDVVGWEGSYQVSDQGRVRSLPRVDCGGYRRQGRVLKPVREKSGHIYVTLADGDRSRRARLHRLVLETFVGPCPPGMEACHFPDRDPANNRVSNLRWDTRKGNSADKRIHGTDHQLAKTSCPRNHKLVGANLTPSSLRQGRRDCLACGRARATIRRRGLSLDLLQELADEEYRRILPESPPMI